MMAVLGGEARILSSTRSSAFAGLANTVERVLRERLPQLDTPQLRDLADDLANAELEAFFEEPDDDEDEEDEEAEPVAFYQGPTTGVRGMV